MSKLTFYLIVIACFILNQAAYGTNRILVSGIVKNDADTPLNDVKIVVNDSIVASTNTNGKFAFDCILEKLTAYFTKDGYKSEKIYMNSLSSNIKDLEVTLYRLTELNEVVVQANSQYEVASKSIYIPSRDDKQYSQNGYQLLENMKIPDLVSSNHNKSVNILNGQVVQCLINGVDAQPDEIATLSAKDIIRIEFQRTPGGKYVGKGGVINFITRQYTYGGNIYLSADNGFAYKYGEYVGFANYKSKAWTTSVTASLKYNKDHKLTRSENMYYLNTDELLQSIEPMNATQNTRNYYGRLKIAHAEHNHSLSVSVDATQNTIPTDTSMSITRYEGSLNSENILLRKSDAKEVSPSINIDYTLFCGTNQYINLSGTASYGHNNSSSLYNETNYDEIKTYSKEHNHSYNGNIAYYYYLNNKVIGLNVGTSYTSFSDLYWGSTNSKQKLNTKYTSALVQWQQTLPNNLYYYISSGFSYTKSTINDANYRYLNPMIYYGGNYAISRNQSISVNGNYLHTIFSPEYKNNLLLRSSFFQYTIGNPDLGVIKSYQNYLTYNANFNKFRVSFSYDFMVYFDNISNKYFIQDNYLYKTLINDGNFYSNRLIASISYGALNNRLRLSGFSIAEFFRLSGTEYKCTNNGIKASFNIAYYLNGWSLKANYSVPYKTLSMKDPSFLDNKSQYGIIVNWNHSNLQIEVGAENFATKYRSKTKYFNYDSWNMNSKELFSSSGRNIYISVIYSLPYGKKNDKPDTSFKSTINNAILKPF
jgi:hypothetical protein